MIFGKKKNRSFKHDSKDQNVVDKMDNINYDEDVKKVIVKSGFNVAEVIIIIIISILFGGIIGGMIVVNYKGSGNGTKLNNNYKSELSEFIMTYNDIINNYYEDVDKDKLIDAAIEGMINSLGDSYSTYMDSTQTTSFNQTVDGSYYGIGATISNVDSKNIIVDMFSDSPAEKSGLKVGDVIQKVGDVDVTSYDIEKLTSLIKGKKGTSVNVTVLRDEKVVSVDVVRDNIDIPSVTFKTFKSNNKLIGYISISTFAANTYLQFNNKLKELEKNNIDCLIIDLRNNPGGHLNQVTSILSMFLPKNKVLYQLETKGVKESIYSSTNTKRDYNVAVIINSDSASASEIMAACFKESYKNSVIIGENSYGKGTVQRAYELKSGSSLKFTVQKWLTPNGNWINKVGVEPDVKVELDSNYWNNPSDDNDNQLQQAIKSVLNLKKES